MNRRRFLALAGLGVTATQAGCVGDPPALPWNARVDPGDVEMIDLGELDVRGEPAPVEGSADQFGGDARNSGYVETTTPSDVTEAWISRLAPGGARIALGSSRLIRQDRSRISILNFDGTLQWELSRPSVNGGVAQFNGYPTVRGDVAYLGLYGLYPSAGDTGIAAVDLDELGIYWWALPDVDVEGPITIAGETIYLTTTGDGSAQFRAVDAETGTTVWTKSVVDIGQSIDRPFRTPLAATENAVFVTFKDPAEVICLNAEDGSLNWRTELGELLPSSVRAPVVTDELVLVSGFRLVALDHEGTIQWSYDAESHHPVYDDELIYLLAESGITAVTFDGEKGWTADIEFGRVIYEPTVTADALVVNDSWQCRCVDLDSQSVRWEYEPEDVQVTDATYGGFRSPPRVRAGEVYVASQGGDVHRLR